VAGTGSGGPRGRRGSGTRVSPGCVDLVVRAREACWGAEGSEPAAGDPHWSRQPRTGAVCAAPAAGADAPSRVRGSMTTRSTRHVPVHIPPPPPRSQRERHRRRCRTLDGSGVGPTSQGPRTANRPVPRGSGPSCSPPPAGPPPARRPTSPPASVRSPARQSAPPPVKPGDRELIHSRPVPHDCAVLGRVHQSLRCGGPGRRWEVHRGLPRLPDPGPDDLPRDLPAGHERGRLGYRVLDHSNRRRIERREASRSDGCRDAAATRPARTPRLFGATVYAPPSG